MKAVRDLMKFDPILLVSTTHVRKLSRIAKKHKLEPQAVLNKMLTDCIPMYEGHCTRTCGLCGMREDAKEGRL